MADSFLLDTSAFITLADKEPGEPGFERVQSLLKTLQKVPFGDAFGATTAQRLNATLVHKDPEFAALAGVIKLHGLPPKGGTGAATAQRQGD